MLSRRALAAVVFAAFLICLRSQGEDAWHRVGGSLPLTVRRSVDRGPVADSLPLHNLRLLLMPSPEKRLALKRTIAELSDPGSPRFRHWLTPAQFGAAFGISDVEEAQLKAWLAANGFGEIRISRARTMISFSGTAQQAEEAFHTRLHWVVADGEPHFTNATEISVPEEFASYVEAVRGLDDFKPSPSTVRVPAFTMSYGAYGIAPGDIASIYGIQSLYDAGIDGAGVTVAVVGQTDVSMSDISAYQNGFGLTENLPRVVLAEGSSDPGISNQDVIEAELDLELLSAVARGASIVYVNSTDAFTSLEYAIDQNLAQVVSVSYGSCEADWSGGALGWYQLLAEEASAQGMTVVAASGDAGAADCDQTTEAAAQEGPAVDFPADIPEVTGVGGTSFLNPPNSYFGSGNGANGGSALSYIPETTWNMSALQGKLEASGGGSSTFFAKPGWQAGAGAVEDGHRDVPDVAFFSLSPGLGYIVCTNGNCASGPPNGGSSGAMWGGTSAAAPVFAGIVALLNQSLLAAGQMGAPGLGNINPQLYWLAANASDVFHDVTQGTNIVPCVDNSPGCTTGSFGYAAGPGYDRTTGLGSVDAGVLAQNWNRSAISGTSLDLTTSSSLIGEGSNVTFTAVVDSDSGMAVPAGTVIFYADHAVLGSALIDASGSATLTATLGVGAHLIQAAYQGNAQFAESLSGNLTVSVAQGNFSMAFSPPSISVTAGDTATTTLVITPEDGFNQQLALTCTGLPSAETCSFGTPKSEANGKTSIGVSIAALSTTARGRPDQPLDRPWLAIFPAAFLLLLRRRNNPRSFLPIVALAVAIVSVAWMVGCGGSNPASGGGSTPTETSVITVTATSTAGVTHSTALSLTVTL